MFFSPLEQFEIFGIVNFLSLNFLLVSNFFVVFLINLNIIFWFFSTPLKIFFFINSRVYFLKVALISFIQKVLKENLLIKHFFMFSFLSSLFLLVLTSNLSGMVPFSFTLTSLYVFTFFFSIAYFLGSNFIGFCVNGQKLLHVFLPGGSPLLISVLLILIELISYFARVFSLSIRLFSNLMAGHTLLKILIEFSFNFLIQGFFFAFLATIPGFIVFIITFLETVIAFMQAYVFLILIVIYLNETIYPH